MASFESTQKLSATVCIPTYNGEQYLESLLTMVFKQDFKGKLEVLIIDSGSSDKTLSIIEKFPMVILHQISNHEFGHGKTRNLAASMAKGDYIVFLSQDAVPATSKWLEYMLEPFMLNQKVVCVFGKQVPRPLIDATTKREVSSVFNSLGPDHSIMINRQFSLMSKAKIPSYLTFFSDVNSAVRRRFLVEKIPYKDVLYSEDQLFGKDVLSNKLIKAYSPLGAVFHSNEYRLRDYFFRKHDEFMGLYESLGVIPEPGIYKFIKKSIKSSLKDYLFIMKDGDYSVKRKLINIPSSTVRNFEREYAAFLVSKDNHRLTNHAKYSLERRHIGKSQ